jgi:hypothetical protein
VPVHRLYGLTIDSEFSLPAPIAPKGSIDMTVTWGDERPVPLDPPAGRVLSQVSLGGVNYSTTRSETGFVIRFPGVCDALVDESLTKVVLVAASAEQRPLAEILLTGSVLAKILMLGGGCVLHASAVANDGRAIAYVGPSGRGKSTMAALACAHGGRLVTDDVLRLVPGEHGWHCPTGSRVVRLRPQAESIASLLNGSVRETLDQRIGVTLDLEDGQWPLAALVFPLPSHTSARVDVERLTEHDTLMRLTSFPRVLGWKDPEVLATSFRWNARLAREVPTYEASIPWGPPFEPSIMSELLRHVSESRPERA